MASKIVSMTLLDDGYKIVIEKGFKPVCEGCKKKIVLDQTFFYNEMFNFFWCVTCIDNNMDCFFLTKKNFESENFKIRFVEEKIKGDIDE